MCPNYTKWPQEAAVDQQLPALCWLESMIFSMDFGAGTVNKYISFIAKVTRSVCVFTQLRKRRSQRLTWN